MSTATRPPTAPTPSGATVNPASPRLVRWVGLPWLGLVVLLLVLTTACSSADSADDAADLAHRLDSGEDTMEDSGAEGEFGLAEDGLERPDQAAPEQDDSAPADREQGAVDQAGGDRTDLAPIGTTSTALTGERIIKEGTVTIEVEPGEFDGAFGQVISRAQALGGHVSGSSSASDDEGLVSGQVTIRIPVRNFEDLLTVLGEAGDIVDRNITSQDVSAEFTDLESRRRNLQAQEAFYLRLLDDAASVSDAIAVQQQLDGIQGQIEQITGRLNLLENRSSFSTLTIRIRELGADGVPPAQDGASLASYVATARDTLIGTVGALIIAVTFVLPFLVLGLLGWWVVRIIQRRPRTPSSDAPTTDPAVMARRPAAPQPTPVNPAQQDGVEDPQPVQ